MTAPAAMEQWISTFLEAQAAEADAARNTRLAYGRDLLPLVRAKVAEREAERAAQPAERKAA